MGASCCHSHHQDADIILNHYPKARALTRFWIWLCLVVGPIGHGGISYLGTTAMLLALATLMSFTWNPLVLSLIAGIVGLSCMLECWGLGYDPVTLAITKKQYRITQAIEKIKNNDSRIQNFIIYWLIPNIFIKIYLAIKYPTDKLPKKGLSKRFRKVYNASWAHALFAPFVKVFGPLSEGAETFMGFIPLLVIAGITSGLASTLSPAALIICSIAFFIAATQNLSIKVSPAKRTLALGFSGVKRALHRVFSSEKKIIYTRINYPQNVLSKNTAHSTNNHINNTTNIENKKIEKNETKLIPLLDELGNTVLDKNLDPIYFSVQVQDVPQSPNQKCFPIKVDAGQYLTKIKKNGKEAHVLDHEGNIIRYIWALVEHEKKQDIEKAKYINKGFFERWLSISAGSIITIFGPLVAAGTAFLGAQLTLASFFSGPSVLILSIMFASIAAWQTFSLDVKRSFQLLQEKGHAIDEWLTKHKNQSKLKALLKSWRALVPDFILKCFNDKSTKEKTWLLVIFGLMIKIFGPTAHGAEAFRASRPIFTALFIALHFTHTIHLSPLVLTFMFIAFFATAIECRALEVKDTLRQLNVRGKKLEDKIEKFFKNKQCWKHLSLTSCVALGFALGSTMLSFAIIGASISTLAIIIPSLIVGIITSLKRFHNTLEIKKSFALKIGIVFLALAVAMSIISLATNSPLVMIFNLGHPTILAAIVISAIIAFALPALFKFSDDFAKPKTASTKDNNFYNLNEDVGLECIHEHEYEHEHEHEHHSIHKHTKHNGKSYEQLHNENEENLTENKSLFFQHPLYESTKQSGRTLAASELVKVPAIKCTSDEKF